jgi:hypothetical protein
MHRVQTMPTKKPRLSLTKAQLQAGIGAELLALCQSITEDGKLSDEEIGALREWLDTNRSSDLPSIEFLAETVERILEDGIVTEEEREELYQAIEKVLPPEARQVASGNRKAVKAEEKARLREAREAQKQKDREERERNRRLMSANFMVAGTRYEGRPEVIDEHVDDGEQVFLVRDPVNRFSRNAVEIRLRNGMQIGYVPEDDAVDVAPLLDEGCPHTAHVTKVLRGGRAPIPVVQAYIYGPDTMVEGLTFPSGVPEKKFPPRDWIGFAVKVAAVIALVVVLTRGLR